MKHINLTITEETLLALDHARGGQERNPFIEAELLQTQRVRRSLQQLQITPPPRTRGRPRKEPE